MKLSIRAIIVLVVFSLAAGTSALAQDAPKNKTLTISGSAGVAGGTMMGLPGNPVTDRHGRYQATVDHGWSGTVAPTKEGYEFEPASRVFANVTSNQDNQNYTPKMLTHTISGNADESGAVMRGLPRHIITDQRGYYSATVPYGWSGMVRPEKSGYRFEPHTLNYARVSEDLANQDYAAKLASSDAASSDPYDSFASSRSGGRGRGSASGLDSMYEDSGSRSRRRSSSGYKPRIHSGRRKVLVIPASEVNEFNAEKIAETVEDMHVMSHILDEGFKEPRRIQGFFTDFGDFFGRDSRSAEATYLQGFGVLFVMEVNFAFSPPPKRQAQEGEESTEAVDSTWQKARRKVLSPGNGEGGLENDHDNQMVEELKKELIETLKHASNIRNVKTDEWIILTVIGGQRQFGMSFGGGLPMGGSMSRFESSTRAGGSSGAGGGMGGGMYGYSSGGYATDSYGGGGSVMYGGKGGMMGGGMMGGGMGGFSEMSVSPATVLTIRAKKSDVDAFARDEQNFEQFRQKVQIFTY